MPLMLLCAGSFPRCDLAGVFRQELAEEDGEEEFGGCLHLPWADVGMVLHGCGEADKGDEEDYGAGARLLFAVVCGRWEPEGVARGAEAGGGESLEDLVDAGVVELELDQLEARAGGVSCRH